MAEAFSDPVNVTTDAEAAPDTPTLSAGTPTETGVTLTSSAFSDANSGDGDTHAASQWQVTTAADTGYATPVISTGDDATHLTSYAATGLTGSTDYIARVRHKDATGLYSNWSLDAEFTTADPPAPEIVVKTDDTERADEYTHDFTTVAQNASLPTEDVVIENSGDASLTVSCVATGDVEIVGTPPTSVAASGSATVTVRLKSTATTGSKTGKLTITSDDADEAQTDINFTASVEDQTAPTVTMRIVGDQLRVTASETVTGDLSQLALTASGGALTIDSGGTFSGTLAVGTLNRTPASDETVTATLTEPSGIEDAATNAVAGFVDEPVTIGGGGFSPDGVVFTDTVFSPLVYTRDVFPESVFR